MLNVSHICNNYMKFLMIQTLQQKRKEKISKNQNNPPDENSWTSVFGSYFFTQYIRIQFLILRLRYGRHLSLAPCHLPLVTCQLSQNVWWRRRIQWIGVLWRRRMQWIGVLWWRRMQCVSTIIRRRSGLRVSIKCLLAETHSMRLYNLSPFGSAPGGTCHLPAQANPTFNLQLSTFNCSHFTAT